MIQNIQKASYINTIPPTSFGRASVARNNQSFSSAPIEDVVIINGEERSLRKKKKKDNTLNVILGLAVAALAIFGICKLISKSQTPKVETPPPEITKSPETTSEINGVKFAGKLKPENLDPLAKQAMGKVDATSLPEQFKDKELRLKLKDHFQKLYNKNISDDELDQLIIKYNNIKDMKSNEFAKNIYYQIKNDYGFSDIDMQVNFQPLKEDKSGKIIYGGYHSIAKSSDSSKTHCIAMDISTEASDVDIAIDKREMGDSIAHEFTHMYQDQIMYRTDKAKFKQNYINRLMEQGKAKKLSYKKEDVEREANKLCLLFENYYGSEPAIQKGTKEYEYAQKCFEWSGRYVNNDEKLYEQSFLESDAKQKGKIMQQIFSLLWNGKSAKVDSI